MKKVILTIGTLISLSLTSPSNSSGGTSLDYSPTDTTLSITEYINSLETEELVKQANEKAAGIDGVLSHQESVQLARELGFKNTSEISLHKLIEHNGSAYLVIGRDDFPFSSSNYLRIQDSKLREYLNNKK